LDQLRRFKPTNRVGQRMQEYQLAKAEAELDHWLYFLDEDEWAFHAGYQIKSQWHERKSCTRAGDSIKLDGLSLKGMPCKS